MIASCQCGWKGKAEDRRTQWGRKSYCPVCGSEAPIRKNFDDPTDRKDIWDATSN